MCLWKRPCGWEEAHSCCRAPRVDPHTLHCPVWRAKLLNPSCVLVSKTQTGTSHIPLDLRNPVQTADPLLKKNNKKEKTKQKYTSNKKGNSVED